MKQCKQYFIDVIKNQYFDFEGTTDVKSFWMYILWYIIFGVILGLISKLLGIGSWLLSIYGLLLLLPSLGISAKRLRDAGFSPWWLLIGLTGIGFIVLIIFWVMPKKA